MKMHAMWQYSPITNKALYAGGRAAVQGILSGPQRECLLVGPPCYRMVVLTSWDRSRSVGAQTSPLKRPLLAEALADLLGAEGTDAVQAEAEDEVVLFTQADVEGAVLRRDGAAVP